MVIFLSFCSHHGQCLKLLKEELLNHLRCIRHVQLRRVREKPERVSVPLSFTEPHIFICTILFIGVFHSDCRISVQPFTCDWINKQSVNFRFSVFVFTNQLRHTDGLPFKCLSSWLLDELIWSGVSPQILLYDTSIWLEPTAEGPYF